MIPAVVLGSSVNGLSYLRSLSKKNIPVLCLDHNRGYASKSRLGTFILLATDAAEDIPGEGDADRVFACFRKHGITPVAFGSADEWQVYIARRSDAPTPDFITLSPGSKVMEAIVDKQAQYEAALGAGIPVPEFANAGDVLTGKVTWSAFPAVIKPRWAHLGRKAIGGKAISVDSLTSLQAKLRELQGGARAEDYLIQKVLAGTDRCLYSYLACYDTDGREFTSMVKRKLRQYPPIFGDGSYDVTCPDAALTKAARKLLTALNYRGLVGVEFKREPGTENFGLIEINPRTVSTNQLAVTAGIDFPWLAYQMAVHSAFPEKMAAPKAPAGYRVGVAHVNEERDFMTFLLRYKAKELGFFEWSGSVMKAESFALWNRSDPWPFINMVTDRISRRLRKLSS
ncbi:MAG: hypothetical protein VR64_23810 [Desulfatitalea sp. BRH_c12]|nr:MAG: hypothetical protein VR64_23810 [Desulfatitalea sp. BRH_c12]